MRIEFEKLLELYPELIASQACLFIYSLLQLTTYMHFDSLYLHVLLYLLTLYLLVWLATSAPTILVYISAADKFSMNYCKWGLLFIYSIMMDILHRHYFIWKLCFTLLQLKNFFLHTYHNEQLLYALKCSTKICMDYGNWGLLHMTD